MMRYDMICCSLAIIIGFTLLLDTAPSFATSAPCNAELVTYKKMDEELKALGAEREDEQNKLFQSQVKQKIGERSNRNKILTRKTKNLTKEYDEKLRITKESYETYKVCVERYNANLSRKRQ